MSLHNRLVHSLKVEQVGTSLVSRLLYRYEDLKGELDPYVVGAACLAHDLGHPPFGHAGEQELQNLLTCSDHRKTPRTYVQRKDQPCPRCKLEDSFEGNAQSFRILTALAVHRSLSDDPEGPIGLDLTRATLAACSKYPWTRGAEKRKRGKWGAYDCDIRALRWVMGGDNSDPSLEAQVMDWADDISYAVHDIEDFFRVGLIPIDDYRQNSERLEKFLNYIQDPSALGELEREVLDAFDQLLDLFPKARFDSTTSDMIAIDNLRSRLLSQFIEAVTVDESQDLVREKVQEQINSILKQMIWYHIIDEPRLANIQAGQQRVLRDLFEAFDKSAADAYDGTTGTDIDEHRLRRLPFGLRRAIRLGLEQREKDEGNGWHSGYTRQQQILRGVVDYLSGLSDAEAYTLHAVLRGREVAGHL